MLMTSDFAPGDKSKVQINPKDSVEEMLVKAGLNWDVEQRDMSYSFGDKKILSGKKALVRSDDGRMLTVSGPNWKPVQNRDIVRMFKEFSDEGGAQLERIGQIRGGRGIWGMAKIDSSFTVAGDDKVEGYVLLASFHEVGNTTKLMTVANRIWCDNALPRSEANAKSKYIQNHSAYFNFTKAKEAIGFAKEEMVQMSLEAKALKALKMSEFETVRLFASHFIEEEGEKLNEITTKMINDEREQPLAVRQILHSYYKAPGASQNNGWGALNAITHWADHTAGTKPDTRLDKATFGSNAKLKNDIKRQLLAMT